MRDWLKYEYSLLCRAWKETRSEWSVTSVIRWTVETSVFFILLYFVAGKVITEDEIPGWAAGLAALIAASSLTFVWNWLCGPYRAHRDAQARVAALEARERELLASATPILHSYIPLTEFRAAAIVAGWHLDGEATENYADAHDLTMGLRQAASQNLFRIWGRVQQMYKSTTLTDNLVPILAEDWKDCYRVSPLNLLDGRPNHETSATNYIIKFSKNEKPDYVDLHIDRTVLDWLAQSAPTFRGSFKRANPSKFPGGAGCA